MTNQDTLINFVRLGIGHSVDELPTLVDWGGVEVLAKQHGLWGVLFDGVERLPQKNRPSQVVWLRWIGEVIRSYEQQYSLYRKAVADLGAWYHAHGYRMMLLKGLACGLDWPRPEHRPYGDIDIYLFGQYKEADDVIARKLGIKIDNSHHHHTVFQWQGFTVENHFDFINVHHQKSNVELEKVLKELAYQDTSSIIPNPSNIVLPSSNLHALFLIKHLVNHFAAEKITLRQILDWAFFVKAHTKEIDWPWLIGVLEKYHMKEFFDCVNAICVKDIGFDTSIFPYVQFNPIVKQRIINDILNPSFSETEPTHFWKRIHFRYRRWKANEWKHELCYNESMSSSFWSGVKSHLLKPSSI